MKVKLDDDQWAVSTFLSGMVIVRGEKNAEVVEGHVTQINWGVSLTCLVLSVLFFLVT